jgi:hypothetical protein
MSNLFKRVLGHGSQPADLVSLEAEPACGEQWLAPAACVMACRVDVNQVDAIVVDDAEAGGHLLDAPGRPNCSRKVSLIKIRLLAESRIMPVVDYYMTLNSPWTYLGSALFAEIAKRNRATVNIKPCRFGPIVERQPRLRASFTLATRWMWAVLHSGGEPIDRFGEYAIVADR